VFDGFLVRAVGTPTRMPLQESEAIVLRSYPLGEADRLVSFLSRSAGRIRGVARGARRLKSRFGASLEPLSHVRIWFYERETRELVRIHQCELLESFLDLQRDYQASCTLALMAEVADTMLPEREAAEGVFRLLLHVAREIRVSHTVALPLAFYTLWMVRLAGWLGDLERCVRCGAPLAGVDAWSRIGAVGLHCRRCRQGAMRTLSAESLEMARRILAARLENLRELGNRLQPLRELSKFYLDLIEYQIDRKLLSRPMVEAGT
jgi:DNA repair protein RecO (recombination protein O)